MKDPVWEASDGALEALLETDQFVEAFHYTYTLIGGGVLRFSAYDADIAYDGHTWPAGAPSHDVASDASWHSGLDVDTWTYKVYPRLADGVDGTPFPDQIDGVSWNVAARSGFLDGATVQVLCAYAAQSPTDPANYGVVSPAGVLCLFQGTIAAIDDMKSSLSINLNDVRQLLTVDFPRNLFGSSCRYVLFSPGCQLVASAFKKSGTIASSSARSSFLSSDIGDPISFPSWQLGRIVFTSGANQGLSRAIRAWSSDTGMFSLIAPLPFPMVGGDTFDAYPGCNKTRSDCDAAGNDANYGGQDFIPPPEIAI
jgi:hypothetical protein